MVRWLVMCARGVFAVQRYLVIMMFGTPSSDRNSAAEDPAGPEPTIRTSVWTTLASGRAVSVTPSLKITIVFLWCGLTAGNLILMKFGA